MSPRRLVPVREWKGATSSFNSRTHQIMADIDAPVRYLQPPSHPRTGDVMQHRFRSAGNPLLGLPSQARTQANRVRRTIQLCVERVVWKVSDASAGAMQSTSLRRRAHYTKLGNVTAGPMPSATFLSNQSPRARRVRQTSGPSEVLRSQHPHPIYGSSRSSFPSGGADDQHLLLGIPRTIDRQSARGQLDGRSHRRAAYEMGRRRIVERRAEAHCSYRRRSPRIGEITIVLA